MSVHVGIMYKLFFLRSMIKQQSNKRNWRKHFTANSIELEGRQTAVTRGALGRSIMVVIERDPQSFISPPGRLLKAWHLELTHLVVPTNTETNTIKKMVLIFHCCVCLCILCMCLLKKYTPRKPIYSLSGPFFKTIIFKDLRANSH